MLQAELNGSSLGAWKTVIATIWTAEVQLEVSEGKNITNKTSESSCDILKRGKMLPIYVCVLRTCLRLNFKVVNEFPWWKRIWDLLAPFCGY